MISNKKDYLDYLCADQDALGLLSFKRPRLFRDNIWKFERLLRRCEYFQNCKKGFLNKLLLKLLKFKFAKLSLRLGFSIPLNVFGKGLSIAHYGTIVVSSEAKIGDYCRIHEGVTIGVTKGAYWGEQVNHAPVLGDNIFLGSGCKIIGEVSVADNVAVGANAVVTKNIEEPNTTWAGVPAKMISNHGSKAYIKRTL